VHFSLDFTFFISVLVAVCQLVLNDEVEKQTNCHTLMCCDLLACDENCAAGCDSNGAGNCDMTCKINWIYDSGTKKCKRLYICFYAYSYYINHTLSLFYCKHSFAERLDMNGCRRRKKHRVAESANSLQFLLSFLHLCDICVVVIHITQITHSHGSARVL